MCIENGIEAAAAAAAATAGTATADDPVTGPTGVSTPGESVAQPTPPPPVPAAAPPPKKWRWNVRTRELFFEAVANVEYEIHYYKKLAYVMFS